MSVFGHVKMSFTEKADLHLRWQWIQDGSVLTPSCKVFFTVLPEHVILDKGLFLENEILAFFLDKLPFSIFSADAHEMMENYATTNPDTSGFFVFSRNLNEWEDRVVPISDTLRTGIFLVCLYDDTNLIYRVMAPGGYNEIPFEVVVPTFMDKLFHRASERLTIKLKDEGDRRMKVVRIRHGGTDLYAAVPKDASLLYFDPAKITPEQLKFCHLSALVGLSEESDSLI